MRGHLQTEFADIPPVEVGGGARAPGAKRGHLALDYTCMKWVQLLSKVSEHCPRIFELLRLVLWYRVPIVCSCFCLAEEAEGREFAAGAWHWQWRCPCT